MSRLIEKERSVIVAADVSEIKVLQELVRHTCQVEGIGGYKIGFELALAHGLPGVVSVIREGTERLPIFYDHQKAASDVPSMGEKFAKACRLAGINAVILFPFGGAETEVSWIEACQDAELAVLIGAHMTQSKFLRSEDGFIADDSPMRIFEIAAKNNVTDFVVPGNRLEYVDKYKNLLEGLLGENNFVLYAPGFIAQGGDITEAGKVAGKSWHAIVGRAIYNSPDPRRAAEKITRQIR